VLDYSSADDGAIEKLPQVTFEAEGATTRRR